MKSMSAKPSRADDVHQPVEQGDVGAGPVAQPDVGVFGDVDARGSATISFAPRCRTARRILVPITGWFSVVLLPMMKSNGCRWRCR